MIENLNNFNANLALKVTSVVGTMWCAYAFTLLAVISLPHAIHQGVSGIVPWVAQTFLQLVLLSIIMVGQDLQGIRTEARAEADHQMIQAEFKELHEVHGEVHELIKDMHVKVVEIHVRK